MQTISSYHRPSGLKEALTLLGRSEANTVVIAGGTMVTPTDLPVGTEVVDIQAAVANTVDDHGDSVTIGGMTRLQDLIDSSATPSLLAELALREGPNTLRNAATIGGTVATANPESELLAGLLVHDATVTIERLDGPDELPLAELLANRTLLSGGIISSISVASGGETSSARTGRTPADTSIVAAAGRVVADGFRVALTGVAATPVVVDPNDLANLNPPADFRGTAEYRRELAGILSKRVVDLLGGAV